MYVFAAFQTTAHASLLLPLEEVTFSAVCSNVMQGGERVTDNIIYYYFRFCSRGGGCGQLQYARGLHEGAAEHLGRGHVQGPPQTPWGGAGGTPRYTEEVPVQCAVLPGRWYGGGGGRWGRRVCEGRRGMCHITMTVVASPDCTHT